MGMHVMAGIVERQVVGRHGGRWSVGGGFGQEELKDGIRGSLRDADREFEETIEPLSASRRS